jgi:sn-glycerol 3-phosphate transport system substrate-binding protein
MMKKGKNKRPVNNRAFIFVLLLCLLALSFASAGGSDQAKSSDKSELTFFYPVNVGGPLTSLIDKICADFTKQNPNTVITPVYTGNYDDTVVKIQTAIQGRNPPDFFINLATQRFSMAASRAAIPLDDLIAADGAAGKAYIDDFLSGFMEDSWVDGKIYSIPFQRSTMVLFYNKDAFQEAGLDPEKPPVNWNELVQYGQRLMKKDASGNVTRYGVGIALNSGSAQWAFTGFALQNSSDGKNLMSEDGKKVYFNTPENVQALQFWLDLQNRHEIMAKGIVQWTDLPGQFLNGQVAMIYHTTGNLTNINSNAKFKFGAAFLPGSRRVAAPTGGGNFFISEGTSKARQEASWKFIKFATEPERAAQWSIDTGYVAVRKSALETQIMKDYYARLPAARVAFDQIPLAKPELTTYDAARIWRVLNDSIQSAITGEATAARAMQNAQAEAEEALRRYQ